MTRGNRGRRRLALLAVALGALLVGSQVAPTGADAQLGPLRAASAARCSPNDRPETGIQGDVPFADQLSGRASQGYNCGLSLVGYDSLGARGGNANMAWSGDCAYIAGDGVAVVDVSDPTAPELVRTLRTGGSAASLETLHAVDAPDRHILVTGRYGLIPVGPGAPVDVWDVSNCREPVLLSTIHFPQNVHNLTLTADGRRVWATMPLQAADLSDPRNPVLLPPIEPELAAVSSHLQYAHEAWPSLDGQRLYLGGQLVFDNEELLVVDIAGWPERPLRVLGSTSTPGHSIREMRIGGRPYLLSSDESILNPTAKGCLPDLLTPFGGAARPAIVDLRYANVPRVVSSLELAINDPFNCVAQVLSGVNASSHYHDVDDPSDTTFAMVSMWNAGLRVFDVRDPAHPREVAYFNPGKVDQRDPVALDPLALLGLATTNGLDRAWGHVRYRPDTGHIWLTTAIGGFWVLELAPQVRAALGLPAMEALHPDGTAPRPPASQVGFGVARAVAATALYCTLPALA